MEHAAVKEALTRIPRSVVLEAVRAEVAAARDGAAKGGVPSLEALLRCALSRASAAAEPSLRRAINATGIVLHTGLGRAVLADAAVAAVAAAARSHSTLEIEPASGRRGSRRAHVEPLLCELTGAEAATVVNNNAGAVFLAVTALAAGREVVISRGELVEIGGSFRVPDIIRASGATLVEVGTTNRTRLSDFDAAVTPNTGLLLRCHPSNFRVVGFTEDVPAADLARLGHERGIPVMDDLGSGSITGTEGLGVARTATLAESLAAGCDIVTASGDKLLGGPQAGLILGRPALIERVAQHPLARALRVDKLTLAALEATLRLYRDPAQAAAEVPTLRYLARSHATLAAMANALAEGIRSGVPTGCSVDLVEERSQVGGGSLPGEDLPTVCVSVRPAHITAGELATRLRRAAPAVFGRLRADALLLDPRAMAEAEVAETAEAVGRVLAAVAAE